MREFGRAVMFLFTCAVSTQVAAQTKPQSASLCELQARVEQGEHRTVWVTGVYSAGLENQQLVDRNCPERSTAIEFALKSHRLWDKLVRITNPSNQAYVVFEGEFYGPPVPDKNLPEAIRREYHPGWNNHSMTKLVVWRIRSVEATLPVTTGGSSAKP